MLGSSICFVFVLAFVDLVNFIGSQVGKLDYRSLIDKPSQVKGFFSKQLAQCIIIDSFINGHLSRHWSNLWTFIWKYGC